MLMNKEYDFSIATDTAREKVQSALSTARQHTEDAVHRGGDYIRERPATSIASAFALGLAVGALVVLAVRPSQKKSRTRESRERLADTLGNIAENLRSPLERTLSSVSEGATSLSDSVAQAWEKIAAVKRKSGWR